MPYPWVQPVTQQFKPLLPTEGRILLLDYEPPLRLCTEEPIDPEPYYEEPYVEES